MPETLRKALTGEPVGEGRRVWWQGRQLYVDSWSAGAGIVWLRWAEDRGGEVVTVTPSSVGLYIGFEGDARP